MAREAFERGIDRIERHGHGRHSSLTSVLRAWPKPGKAGAAIACRLRIMRCFGQRGARLQGGTMNADWRADRRFLSFEERIKHGLVPARLYLRNLAERRRRRGEAELRALPLLARRGTLAVDIGANKGVYSYWLSQICHAVMAFEPNPKICALLRRAVPDNVTVHGVALSNASGSAELILPIQRSGRYSNQGGTLQAKKLDPTKPFGIWTVEQRRLDDYAFTDVSFIKIDVEGFELEVLQGAAETLRRERPTLLIEIDESQSKRPFIDTIAALTRLGYIGYFLDRGALRHLGECAAPGRKPATDNFIFFHGGA
jgi:FkbM family methyltransferase